MHIFLQLLCAFRSAASSYCRRACFSTTLLYIIRRILLCCCPAFLSSGRYCFPIVPAFRIHLLFIHSINTLATLTIFCNNHTSTQTESSPTVALCKFVPPAVSPPLPPIPPRRPPLS
ncbi:hypothetical protein B0H13DRAFT_1204605 [Mycena leptocephala]|nr:hypothetical protein B0H13DRAFT_1204605 [Mycena leptocephala]